MTEAQGGFHPPCIAAGEPFKASRRAQADTGTLVIGDLEGGSCEIPTLDTHIACHDGLITQLSHAGIQGPAATSCAFAMPKRLTRSNVGRGAQPAFV